MTWTSHCPEGDGSDEAVALFGGVGTSGAEPRFGGATANIEAFTDAGEPLRGADLR